MNTITTHSALKLRMGATDYFVVTMKTAAAVARVRFDCQIPRPQSIEEAYQRDINYARVKTQIAPYLAQNKDRFFGSIILAAKNFNPAEDFEPLSQVATKGLPRLYQTQTSLMGFLTLQDGVVLIPLDGQHRVKALDFAIKGRDEKGEPIEGFSPDLSLANDDVTVILIPYNEKKSRRIFTKVNRYAKTTTTGQNLVIDDDDIIAVLSRRVANNPKIIGPDLVKYKSNTLTDKDGFFTTLATIAECNIAILEANFPKINRAEPVRNETQRSLYEKKVDETWSFLAENITLFADALADKKKSGNARRVEIREDYLLGKPVPQYALVKAFTKLTNWKLTPTQAAAKLNAVPWRKDERLWDRVLFSGGKILHKNKGLAADLLCYLCGKPADGDLLEKYRAAFQDPNKKLPPQLK